MFLGIISRYTAIQNIQAGEIIILCPVKPDWNSFLYEDKADADFLSERPDIIEEGRVKL